MASEIHNFRTIGVEANKIFIKTENILKSLQVPADKADKYLTDQIETYRITCSKISKPYASYSIHENPDFNPKSGELVLNNTTFSLGKIVCNALKQSTKVAFFICTCGDTVEKLSKQLMAEGHSLEGYIVDLVGSEIAEGIADIIHKLIGDDMKKANLNITNRYSPGYCNWPVSDQQNLFLMLQDTCGVSLTPSSLMIPIKSVSGIVGIGPDVKFRGYECSKCDAAFCIYRDKK